MMSQIKYKRFNTVDAVSKFLDNYGDETLILAGGTDLLIKLRAFKDPKVCSAKYILDLTFLKDSMGSVQYNQKTCRLKIGALVTHSEISDNQLVKGKAGILTKAASVIGSPQIRNRGTIGGNIVNASPAADMLPALAVLNAKIVIKGVDNEKKVDLEDFIKSPYSVNLKRNEFVLGVEIDTLKDNCKWSFHKIGRRNSLAISRVNFAIAAEKSSSGRLIDVRICPGSVTPSIRRINKAEKMMIGEIPTQKLIEDVSGVIANEVISLSGIRGSFGYKIPVIKAVAIRALKEVI